MTNFPGFRRLFLTWSSFGLFQGNSWNASKMCFLFVKEKSLIRCIWYTKVIWETLSNKEIIMMYLYVYILIIKVNFQGIMISNSLQYPNIKFSIVVLFDFLKCYFSEKNKFCQSHYNRIYNNVILVLSFADCHRFTLIFLWVCFISRKIPREDSGLV